MKFYILILFSALFANSLFAQENLSLANALEIALQNNYDIQVSALDVETAKVNNSWGTVGKLPTVDASGLAKYQVEFDDEDTLNSKSSIITNAGIKASWVLFNGFSANISKSKLNLLEQMAGNNTQMLIESTIHSVVLAYYKVLLENEKFILFDEIYAVSTDRYEYEKMRKELGSSTSFNLLQAKNAYLEDKANVLMQELSLRSAVRSLNLLLARPENDNYFFTDSLSPQLNEYAYEELKNAMLSDNKNITMQYLNLNLMDKEIMLAKSAYSPQIALQAGADIFNNTITLDSENARIPNIDVHSSGFDYYAAATLSFNIYGGGKRQRAMKIAKIEKQIGEIETQKLEHTLTNTLSSFYEMYNVRKELFSVALENREAAKLNMQIAREKYKSGSINSFNYRDIQLAYERSAINYVNAVYNLISSQMDIEKLTGKILQRQ